MLLIIYRLYISSLINIYIYINNITINNTTTVEIDAYTTCNKILSLVHYATTKNKNDDKESVVVGSSSRR